MLIAENAAAVVAFCMWLAAFALGYALRDWMHGAREELEASFPYRQGGRSNDR